MTRPRYIAVTDGRNGPHGTASVIDAKTDRTIVDRLPRTDAEALARDWSRHEPPDPAICVHDDGTSHVKQVPLT